jgi:hypothetical protein
VTPVPLKLSSPLKAVSPALSFPFAQSKVGNKWSEVAKHIPGRTGQQCAQRWRHKVGMAGCQNHACDSSVVDCCFVACH